jgi:anti-sigma regulatory factor (Ser/Thr protein kinase)
MACDIVTQANPQLVQAAQTAEHRHMQGRAQDANAARVFVASQLRSLPDDVVYTARLLTSELVANVVLHAGAPFVLGVSIAPDWVLITVADEDRRSKPRPRAAPDPELLAESGRGFQILSSEAADFGWHTMPNEVGKVVWFTIPTHRHQQTPAADARQRPVAPG